MAAARAAADDGAGITVQVNPTLPAVLYFQPEYSKVPSILFQPLPNKKVTNVKGPFSEEI